MVLGIVGLVLSFCVPVLPIIMCIVGVILSGVSMSKAKSAGMKNGMAVAGLVCSIIPLAISIGGTIFILVAGGGILSSLGYAI